MVEDNITKIEADSIVIEVTDKDTGKVFRRELPIKFLENGNGLILYGETFEGKPSQIAFFSETARTKIKDLLGHGPDFPRCGEK